jgi:hypothetical protein
MVSKICIDSSSSVYSANGISLNIDSIKETSPS